MGITFPQGSVQKGKELALPAAVLRVPWKFQKHKGQSQQSTSEGMGTYAYAAVKVLTEHWRGGQHLSH